MKEIDLYTDSHLVVAAIRILEYKSQKPPTDQEVLEYLNLSIEQGHRLLGKMHELGIIEIMSGNYGTRLFIRNHLNIENIPKNTQNQTIQDEIVKFKLSKKGLEKKIEAIQEQQSRKQKELFAEMENKLKQSLKKSKL